MAKIDMESAYRLFPVYSTDRPLQAMEWKGQIYVDPMLPFGLRSAPKLFNAVADAPEWYMRQRGIQHVSITWMTSLWRPVQPPLIVQRLWAQSMKHVPAWASQLPNTSEMDHHLLDFPRDRD